MRVARHPDKVRHRPANHHRLPLPVLTSSLSVVSPDLRIFIGSLGCPAHRRPTTRAARPVTVMVSLGLVGCRGAPRPHPVIHERGLVIGVARFPGQFGQHRLDGGPATWVSRPIRDIPSIPHDHWDAAPRPGRKSCRRGAASPSAAGQAMQVIGMPTALARPAGPGGLRGYPDPPRRTNPLKKA